MSDEIKIIREALVEMQRKINEQEPPDVMQKGSELGDSLKKGAKWIRDKAKGFEDDLDRQTGKQPATASSSTPTSTTPKSDASTSTPAPKTDTPKPTGSVTTNDKPTSIVKTKGGDYNVYAKGSEKAADFRKAYADAKGNFEWEGRKYAKPSSETSKPATSTAAPLPPKRPEGLGTTSNGKQTLPSVDVGKPSSKPSAGPEFPKNKTSGIPTPPTRPEPQTWETTSKIGTVKMSYPTSPVNVSRSEKRNYQIDNPEVPQVAPEPKPLDLNKPESESGGKRKKMSEETNPLIAAFMKLQSENPQNMFEAAKKAKKDYDGDGKIESPKDEVWGSRFRAAKAAGKMEEGNIDPVVTGSKSVTSSPKGYVDPSTPTQPYTKAPMSTGAGDVLDKAKNALDKTGVKEEVELDEISKEKLHKYISNSLNSISNKRFRQGHFAHSNFDGNKNNAIHDYDQAIENKKKGDQRQKSIELAAKKLSGMAKVAATEEVEFSQEEIDHINSFFLEASVAPNRPEVAIGADSTSDKMSQNDVTGTAESGKKKIRAVDEARKTRTEDGLKGSVEFDTSSQTSKASDETPDVSPIKSKIPPEASWTMTDKPGGIITRSRGETPTAIITRSRGETPRAIITKEETDAAEETNMAKTQLKAMASKAKNLHSKLKTSKNLPAWVQSKLAVAKDGVTSVDDYMTHKEETLEEGRPKKNPTPETTERDPRKHIQVEAGRAAAGNVIDFHHNDGSKSKITPPMGRKIVAHLQGLKPADRQAAVNKMHDSPEGLKI